MAEAHNLGSSDRHGVVAGTWTIDPAHSTVGFTVRHLMSRVRGRFEDFHGQIVTTDDTARASLAVELASVNTGNPMRDDDLRSSRYFDVTETPTMTFESTALRPGDGRWILDGDLTIHGVTKRVEIDVELLGVDETGLMGETRVGFSGRTTIHRSEFGIDLGLADTGKIVVADAIDVELDIEAARDAGD